MEVPESVGNDCSPTVSGASSAGVSTLIIPESVANGCSPTGGGSKVSGASSGASKLDGWSSFTTGGVASTVDSSTGKADSGPGDCSSVVSGGFSGTREDNEEDDASTKSTALPSASLVLMTRLPEPKLTASELRLGAEPDRPFGNAGTGSSVEKLDGVLDKPVPVEMHLFLGQGDSSADGRGDPGRLTGAPLGRPRPGTRLP